MKKVAKIEDVNYAFIKSNKFDEGMLEMQVKDSQSIFQTYEKQFKALADARRLELMHKLCNNGKTCVCDLSPEMDMPQSKLSYHLKILLDAGLIKKETRGTWSYYWLNEEEVNHLLSEQLCCLFRPRSC